VLPAEAAKALIEGMGTPKPGIDVRIRPLAESDLPEADRIVRLAFGTFLGLPDPSQFMGDTDYVRTRWRSDPSAAVAAEHAGKLIGTNFATNWGSFGFFGPLTVEPAYWDTGVAQQLLAPTMDIFKRWNNKHLGLFTFAHSPKHISLYQKFGFWPRDLLAIMGKQVGAPPSGTRSEYSFFSQAQPDSHEKWLNACREVTHANFDGLDLEREILAVATQNLGDTVLLWHNSTLIAFAVCHVGAGTEAGTGICYVKFAAVRPGFATPAFVQLLSAVEGFARSAGAEKIVAGVNLARRQAFTEMFGCGFRTERQGVAMETGKASSGYNRADVYILDDWR
jgi:GNAT superfamily N-acetyltransferase